MESFQNVRQEFPQNTNGTVLTSPLLTAAREKSVQDIRKLADNEPEWTQNKNKVDPDGNTAVHLVLAEGCYCEPCQKNGEICLEILLTGGVDPNRKNNNGKTPMHLVADNRIPMGMVRVLIRFGASLSGKDGIEDSELAKKLITNYPEAVLATFDNGITFVRKSANAHDPVQLDWRYLTYDPVKPVKPTAQKNSDSDDTESTVVSQFVNFFKDVLKKITRGDDGSQETKFLYDIVRNGNYDARKKLLGHPLVHAFLELKQKRYVQCFGAVHFVFLMIGSMFYFAFLWSLYYQFCSYNGGGGRDLDCNDDDFNETLLIQEIGFRSNGPQLCVFTDSQWIELVFLGYLILALVVLGPLILEFRKGRNYGMKDYSKRWQTWITLIAIALVFSTIWPVLVMNRCMKLSWEYPWAAASVVVSSIAVMIQLNHIPVVAVHLEMVYKVFKKMMITAACLIPLYVGFFASFRILITNDSISFFKLLTMLVGDTDYDGLLDQGRGRVYEWIAYAIFAIFIIVMIIVVLNFLIGIAVSDIQELKESAATNNKVNQIFSFYLMDCVLGGFRNMRHTLVKPGKEESYTYEIHPLKDDAVNWKYIPKQLQFSLLDVARAGCRRSGNANASRGRF